MCFAVVLGEVKVLVTEFFVPVLTQVRWKFLLNIFGKVSALPVLHQAQIESIFFYIYIFWIKRDPSLAFSVSEESIIFIFHKEIWVLFIIFQIFSIVLFLAPFPFYFGILMKKNYISCQ